VVERGGGLVRKQYAGSPRQHSREGHPLPLAAGELIHQVPADVVQTHGGQRVRGPTLGLTGGHPGVEQRQHDVLRRGQHGRQAEGLRHQRHPGRPCRVRAGDLRAVHQHDP
jgi:hypothetical protein